MYCEKQEMHNEIIYLEENTGIHPPFPTNISLVMSALVPTTDIL